MYENDVFDVTVFDRGGNELCCTHIKGVDRVTDWLADKVLEDERASKATVYGQHYQFAEIDLDELHDRMVIEGYVR